MKKKILKVLALVACAVLLVVGSIAGTLAYMTSTASVKNTFTVGNVSITMDEAVVNENGKATDATNDRTTEGNSNYKLIPNHEYDKDPTIYVDANSEDCWLFVKVVNGIANIEDKTENGYTIAAQMAANGWTVIDETNGIYAHSDIAEAGDEVTVFETFKVSGTVTNEDLTGYKGATVDITAYAIQADGFGTAALAWAAASSSFN